MHRPSVACLALGGFLLAANAGAAEPGVSADNKADAGARASAQTSGQAQPQGATGPLTTGTGGAPAASPQGETPPGMQAAPNGSSAPNPDGAPGKR
jgi:hypothetical protein